MSRPTLTVGQSPDDEREDVHAALGYGRGEAATGRAQLVATDPTGAPRWQYDPESARWVEVAGRGTTDTASITRGVH